MYSLVSTEQEEMQHSNPSDVDFDRASMLWQS